MEKHASKQSFASLSNVHVARGHKVVLHDVNLTIAEGEHVAILGPNGCGKSTLIKTLTCECYPLAAPGTSVKIFGRDRWVVEDLRKRLGVVSADAPSRTSARTTGLDMVVAGFFNSSTLWSHLEVSEQMQSDGREALCTMEASNLKAKLVGEMSAGELRRVMIARALVHRPGMLLLDEPSNALDMAAQRDLRTVLRRVAQGGTGILMVTHHLADVLPEIQRVIMMKAGRIIADGSRQELLTRARLEALYGITLDLVERDGFLHSW